MAIGGTWAPKRAEVIFINQSPKSGNEIGEWHPLLVCSEETFNRKTGIVIGFPMSHSEFNKDNPFVLTTKGALNEDCYVIVYQPKSFDWQARTAKTHAMGEGHNDLLKKAFDMLDTICNIKNK